MSTPITISGTSFNLPNQGTNPPWADDLDAIIVALAAVANSSSGPSDILNTSFTIANNVVSVANVSGASFDPTAVRSFILQYSIYITSSTTELSECGQIMATYKTVASSWEIAQTGVGSSGVVFSMTSGGQLKYTSSNVSGTSYVGKMKFAAKSFLQT